MNEYLKKKLERVRGWLEGEPGRVVVGEVHGAAAAVPASVPVTYADFLAVSDGARFGEVDLWSVAGLEDNSWVGGDGFEGWVSIGQLVYEPLLMDEQGNVVMTPEHGTPVSFGAFDDFLDAVLGDGYQRLFKGAEESRWFDALAEIGLR